MSSDVRACRPEGMGPCPTDSVEDLVRCVALRLADELGPEEAVRLVAPLVRALTGAMADAADHRTREEIVRAGRRLGQLGFVSGMSGNLSVRDSADTLWITPASRRKGELAPDDMVRLDLKGNVLTPGRVPSSEFRVHLIVYRERPDIHAVVHTHPPFATGFAAAGVPLDQPILAESLLVLGPAIPVVPYGMPSTWELAERLAPYLPGHQAFLLANHGALALGATLGEAVHRTEVLEFYARVLLTARLLGGERLLSAEDLERLASVRGYGTAR